MHGLPLDHYRTLAGRVDAVTGPEVQRVARQFLRLDELVVVAVGDRDRILGDLANLGWGAIEEADPDGEPLKQG